MIGPISYILHRRFLEEAQRVLRTEFSCSEVKTISTRTIQKLQNIPEAKIPNMSYSVKKSLELARLNMALYDALMETRVSQDRSEALIDLLNWQLLSPSLRIITRWLRWRGFSSLDLLSRSYSVFWKFVFTRPFLMVEQRSADEITYDVKRCPFMEYYAEHDRRNVCKAAACNQDYRMADLCGVELIRSRTLCKGDDVCDFRFHAIETSSSYNDA